MQDCMHCHGYSYHLMLNKLTMLHGKLMHVFQSVALVIINELLQLKHKDYCYKLCTQYAITLIVYNMDLMHLIHSLKHVMKSTILMSVVHPWTVLLSCIQKLQETIKLRIYGHI